MAKWKVTAIIYNIEAENEEAAKEKFANIMYVATSMDNVPDTFEFEVEEN